MLDNHFVKLNSSDFADAPIIFHVIIVLEVSLSVLLLICMPFVLITFHRTRVVHRNFRLQICCAFVYFMFQIYCRFVLLYYELKDIPNSYEDRLLFWIETMRMTIIGSLCALPISFAFERFIATHYWSWYEKGSSSTLWVLLIVQVCNITPAFIIAWLCYTDRISIIVNFLVFGFILTLGLVLFIITFLINVRTVKQLAKGATIDAYSVSRTFQVQENVELMTYMCKLALPAATSSSVAVLGFSFKMFAPPGWRFSGNVSYACFDLGVVMQSQRRIFTISAKSETDSYFSQLQTSWA